MTGEPPSGKRRREVATHNSRIRDGEAFGSAFGVSRETVDALEGYVALLKQWQSTINLVAPGTLDDIWHRHIADSAQLLDLAPPAARTWLDLGSGAGFPGLVLAILLHMRPGARVTLVESDARKAAFLREAARRSAAPVDILCMRIENLATQSRFGPVDVVTARALAPLPRLLELASPVFAPETVALFLKGRDVEAELGKAHLEWTFDGRLVPSRTDPEGRIVVVRRLEKVAGG